jgi:hypothetical protein
VKQHVVKNTRFGAVRFEAARLEKNMLSRCIIFTVVKYLCYPQALIEQALCLGVKT